MVNTSLEFLMSIYGYMIDANHSIGFHTTSLDLKPLKYFFYSREIHKKTLIFFSFIGENYR